MYLSSIIVPLAILAPNLIFIFLQPKDKPQKQSKNPLVLEITENIGRIGIILIPLLYKLSLSPTPLLLAALASLAGYYYCWLRYFTQNRKYSYLFLPLWHIPVPMAIFPVLYMMVASGLFSSWPLLLATLVFSAGHISISYREYIGLT